VILSGGDGGTMTIGIEGLDLDIDMVVLFGFAGRLFFYGLFR
jgi:hypothetical protein